MLPIVMMLPLANIARINKHLCDSSLTIVDIDPYFNEQENKFLCSNLIKLLILVCNVTDEKIRLEMTAHLGFICLYLHYYCYRQSVVSLWESF